ncbi:hypothetical protein [Persephonella sp.]
MEQVKPVEWELSHDEAGSPTFKCGEEVTCGMPVTNPEELDSRLVFG